MEPTIETEVKTTVSLEEFEALKATNTRILDEHKADKIKYKSRIESYEKQQSEELAANNDYKSLYEQSVNKVTGLEDELTDSRYNSFTKNLTLEVGKLAKDAHNPKAIMRALNINNDNTDLDNGTLTDLSNQIDSLRKEESYLFGDGQVSQTNTVPRYVKQATTNDKPETEMSVTELESKLRNRISTRMG